MVDSDSSSNAAIGGLAVASVDVPIATVEDLKQRKTTDDIAPTSSHDIEDWPADAAEQIHNTRRLWNAKRFDTFLHYVALAGSGIGLFVVSEWLGATTASRWWIRQGGLLHVFALGSALTCTCMVVHVLLKKCVWKLRGYHVADPTGDVDSAIEFLSRSGLLVLVTSTLFASSAMGLYYVLVYWTIWNLGSCWWLLVAGIACVRDWRVQGLVAEVTQTSHLQSSPLQNPSLRDRLTQLTNKLGVEVEDFYSVECDGEDSSLAYVSLDAPVKICLGKSLLESCSAGEITAIVAHELGHVTRNHTFRKRLVWLLATIATYACIDLLLTMTYPDLRGLHPASSIPIFFVVQLGLSALLRPLTLWLARRHEVEADEIARQYEPKHWRLALLKLAAQNGEDPSPSRWTVFSSYSHPTMQKRLNLAGVPSRES